MPEPSLAREPTLTRSLRPDGTYHIEGRRGDRRFLAGYDPITFYLWYARSGDPTVGLSWYLGADAADALGKLHGLWLWLMADDGDDREAAGVALPGWVA